MKSVSGKSVTNACILATDPTRVAHNQPIEYATSDVEWFAAGKQNRSYTMKITTTLKTLTMLGLTTLTLAATSSQADNGYGYYGGNPNPWVGAAPNTNPWLASPAMNQMRYLAAFKQRQAELDQRQDAQMQRILNGMESGKLTSREAAALIREHLAIANLERSYMADGRLGPEELISLEKRLAEADQHIQYEKNDREQSGPKGKPGDMGRPGDYGRH